MGLQTGNSSLAKESGWLLSPVSAASLLVKCGIFNMFLVYQVRLFTKIKWNGEKHECEQKHPWC